MKSKITFSILFTSLSLIMQAQWVTQAAGWTTPYRSIGDFSIVNSNVAWAIGGDSSFFNHVSVNQFTRTINGGTTHGLRVL